MCLQCGIDTVLSTLSVQGPLLFSFLKNLPFGRVYYSNITCDWTHMSLFDSCYNLDLFFRDSCSSPVSPDSCILVQTYLGPSRMFIAHAYAQLKTGLQTQERHLFLFTDILLISKAK